MEPESASDVAARLATTGYLCDGDLATVTFLALRMQRPLLLEGEPGTGKTALAEAIAESLELPLVRLQCYEGIDATQALYDWDFPRQILHLRAMEAVAGDASEGTVEEAEKSPVRRAVPARPSGAGRAPAEPRGAAGRRGRPGRRRVRGVPARGALDLPGQHPRARHRQGRDPAGRGAHLQPHPRAARRAQATLPLPLDRPPRSGPRGRDRPDPRARGARPSWPSRWSGSCSSCGHATTWPSRPASPRPSTGRGRSTSWAPPELDLATAAATLGALVKYREDGEKVRHALDQMLRA